MKIIIRKVNDSVQISIVHETHMMNKTEFYCILWFQVLKGSIFNTTVLNFYQGALR